MLLLSAGPFGGGLDAASSTASATLHTTQTAQITLWLYILLSCTLQQLSLASSASLALFDLALN